MATEPGLGAVLRGVRLIGTFSGRDTRPQFWSYTVAVIVVWLVVGNLVTAPIMISMAWRGGPRAGGADAYLIAVAVALVVLVVFLAAAVTRRLRDRGATVVWAVAPLVILGVNLSWFFRWEPGDEGFPWVAVVGTLLYFPLVIALIVQLALPPRRVQGAVR